MEEKELVAKVAENIPKPVEDVPVVASVLTGLQDHTTVDYGLDEITHFKLHDILGEEFKSSDYDTKKNVAYVYNEVAKMVPSGEYVDIVNKMQDLLGIAGLLYSERKAYKLSEWLRLRNIANNAHKNMEILRHG